MQLSPIELKKPWYILRKKKKSLRFVYIKNTYWKALARGIKGWNAIKEHNTGK